MRNASFVEQWANVEQPKNQPKNTGALSDKSLQTLLDKHCREDAHHGDLLAFVGACNSIGVPEKDCLAFLLANQDRVSDQSSYFDNSPQIERLVDSVYSLYDGQHGEHKKEPPAGPQSRQNPKRRDSPTPEEHDYTEILNSAKIDVVEELPPPPVCLSFAQGPHKITIGTMGNFSMIIGKAKSRKTFFVTILLAAWIRNFTVLGKVQGSLPSDRRTVLHFDTEQGKYHVQRTAKRALRLAGQEHPNHYRPYGLRRFAPDVRLGVIEHAIYEDNTVGAVVIDGIRDLSSLGINNEEEATTLTTKLLKWTEERQIHVVVILHQNKNDANARGHLGTELVNKAETVLSITKDEKNRELSMVEAEYCRDMDPEPFGFCIDEEGLPQLAEHWELKADKYNTQKGITPLEIPQETHQAALKKAFEKDPKLRYNDLVRQLKQSFELLGRKLSDNKVKDCIVYYKNESFLSQEGKEGTATLKYSLKGTGLTGLV